MKMKAILFDLDNTLVNTHEILNNYLIKISQKYYKITPKEEHQLETTTIEGVEEWMKLHGIKINPLTKITMLLHFIFTDIKHIQLKKDAKKILGNMQKKLALGIITNGPSIYAKKIMRINKIKNYFQTIQTATTNKAKPNPEMIYKAAKKLAVKPSECIVVDDGKQGIIAGKKAGCKTIYLSSNKNIKSDFYAKNLSEVEKIIKKLI